MSGVQKSNRVIKDKVKLGMQNTQKETKTQTAPEAPGDNVAFRPFENSIYDMSGLMLLLDDLNLIERALFRGKDGLISQKARDFTSSSIILLFEEIEKTGLEPSTDAKQLEFVKDLVKYLKNLPVVRVTLAFGPTNTFVKNLSLSISDEMNRKVVIDLIVDQFIVAGAVFEYGGKVSRETLDIKLDATLRKYIGVLGEGQGFKTQQ